ncbi:MAG TPA: flagellin [Methanosarcina sp.]|nr:flagellin [Methanosarcina sp.]
MWNRLLKNDKGFTGLEAAIVLVAFVVVAAVFSYVMLGAGFYTTQKSQEVVHTGVAQASSSLSPSGDVIVRGTKDADIDNITFYITNTAGGSSVDLNKTIITYIDDDDFVTQDELSADWKYEPVISTGYAWNLVEKGEKYKISMDLTTGNVTSRPKVNERIRIDVKPPEGAVLIVQKSMPPAIANNTYYAVY